MERTSSQLPDNDSISSQNILDPGNTKDQYQRNLKPLRILVSLEKCGCYGNYLPAGVQVYKNSKHEYISYSCTLVDLGPVFPCIMYLSQHYIVGDRHTVLLQHLPLLLSDISSFHLDNPHVSCYV